MNTSGPRNSPASANTGDLSEKRPVGRPRKIVHADSPSGVCDTFSPILKCSPCYETSRQGSSRRKRGRPRKHTCSQIMIEESTDEDQDQPALPDGVLKKRRGRPRKCVPSLTVENSESVLESSLEDDLNKAEASDGNYTPCDVSFENSRIGVADESRDPFGQKEDISKESPHRVADIETARANDSNTTRLQDNKESCMDSSENSEDDGRFHKTPDDKLPSAEVDIHPRVKDIDSPKTETVERGGGVGGVPSRVSCPLAADSSDDSYKHISPTVAHPVQKAIQGLSSPPRSQPSPRKFVLSTEKCKKASAYPDREPRRPFLLINGEWIF